MVSVDLWNGKEGVVAPEGEELEDVALSSLLDHKTF
jgi:hypothetical protein